MTALNDRYEVFGLLASGGMASVLYGRLRGPAGFAREVAIKRLHPHFARESEFLSMFIDEAHICARLSHANIVSALDVIDTPPDLCLVMEYVAGAGLDILLHAARARGLSVPVPVAVALTTGVLHGLHAAHEARDERGQPLGIVHRDVSPSNVLVGEDGVARVFDFGIAKALSKLRTTPSGEIKGKFPYMAPELLRGHEVDRRFDVYASAVVLWEILVGRPLFGRQPSASIIKDVLEREVEPPSRERKDVSAALDAIVMNGLAREPGDRLESAFAFAMALENTCPVASQSEVAAWVRSLVGDMLEERAAQLRRYGRDGTVSRQTLVTPPELRSTGAPALASEVPESTPPATLTPAAPSSRVETVDHLALPAPARRVPRWLVLALVALVLCVVVGVDAVRQRSIAEANGPVGGPDTRLSGGGATRAAGTSAGAPARTRADRPLVDLGVGREPQPSVRPLVDASLVEAGTIPGRVARRPEVLAKPSDRARPALKRGRVVAPQSEPASSPGTRQVGASVDCAQTFELERVDGVVVKTFKPGCLR